ncbi:MAG: SagB/ThcOx family dehydrogenase [Chlorobium phaeobacteroides]|uniref:Nitroreductase domain-containing protein n=1 Tax=Chlorobium phaeobacteroides (strain BS1) TaxID=331678 RepID=B3EQF1_CHLPB|nr:SagB/ThcOx family dehydrogenase [Chlorobium phaeobacteroides]MBL6956234.1 SagB/ThcOx family dehydrogenase [Chlorobium phaeobacteroides]NEX14644.1 thioester oxidase [Prosthecochloris sp.]
MQAGRKPHEKLEEYRYFLKDSIRQEINFTQTAQSRRLPAPSLQKPSPEDAVRIDLPEGPRSLQHCCRAPVGEAIMERESVRFYSDEALTLEELSALLWATQGVRHVLSEECALRTVPSAGARHSFETYIAAQNVKGLQAGLYRYLPLEHQLVQLFVDELIGIKAARACMDQRFVAGAAATFFWTTIPERMEWRYGLAAHKVIALDAGHVCQNLYLACTALGAGTCAIAAYDQTECDRLLGVDGDEEFTVYISPVGKV